MQRLVILIFSKKDNHALIFSKEDTNTCSKSFVFSKLLLSFLNYCKKKKVVCLNFQIRLVAWLKKQSINFEKRIFASA